MSNEHPIDAAEMARLKKLADRPRARAAVRQALASSLDDDTVCELYLETRLGRLRRVDRRRAAIAASRRLTLPVLLDACDHRALQRACGELGVGATGRSEALRRRISGHASAHQARYRTVAWVVSEDGLALRVRAQDLPLAIGRSSASDIAVPDHYCSRRHCVLSLSGERLRLTDAGSRNGTIVDDQHLRPGSSVELGDETVLVLGRRFMRIVNELPGVRRRRAPKQSDVHGIVVFDIADSSRRSLDEVARAVDAIDHYVQVDRPSGRLLAKNTGDGIMAVFQTPRQALEVAWGVLQEWEEKGESLPPLRVAVEAGTTHPTPMGDDRVGLPLIRVARIEKVQAGDVDRPSRRIGDLRVTGRIVVGEGMHDALSARDRRACRFLGRMKLKGFGERLFRLYQLEGAIRTPGKFKKGRLL